LIWMVSGEIKDNAYRRMEIYGVL